MTTSSPRDLFDRLEIFYDAVPRDRARVEAFGALVLFVPDGVRHPFYARPTLGAAPSASDIATVRARQRELGLPEAFEWVHETSPGLLAVAEGAGLSVLKAPLLVLDPALLPAPDAAVRILDASSPEFEADLATSRAVAATAFGAAGTARGAQGTAERDAARAPIDPTDLAKEIARTKSGLATHAVATSPVDGVVASGVIQRVGGIAEIVGIATLPFARRRGLGAAVTASLARHAFEAGADLVFLTAGSEVIAHVYISVGFQRVGTACVAEAPAPPAA